LCCKPKWHLRSGTCLRVLDGSDQRLVISLKHVWTRAEPRGGPGGPRPTLSLLENVVFSIVATLYQHCSGPPWISSPLWPTLRSHCSSATACGVPHGVVLAHGRSGEGWCCSPQSGSLHGGVASMLHEIVSFYEAGAGSGVTCHKRHGEMTTSNPCILIARV
jgi:hypothetical protein